MVSENGSPTPPDGPFAVVLDGSGHDRANVGSKAAWLDRLVGAGFAVPSAFAITTAAYRCFVAETRVSALIDRLLASPPPSPGQAERSHRAFEKAVVATSLPPALESAIGNLASLAAGLGAVSVRSSASAEDLAGASFAGQYLSILEVEGRDAIIAAIKRVWASLWSPWARAYRRQLDHDDAIPTMAVIVQRMVPAERSGVAFTVDPAWPTVMRLEVVAGLGERLVSGRVTPDVYQLRRPGLQPVSGPVPDPALRAAAHAALRVEEAFGRVPQDVEWSIVDGKVWLLQARPITRAGAIADKTTDGFDTAIEPGDRYATTGVTEMLPGVLPPLSWTINGPMVEDAFRDLFHRLGFDPDRLSDPFAFIGRSRGRAAINLSEIQRAGSRVAGWSPAEVERLYLGTGGDDGGDEGGGGHGLRNLLMNVRAYRVRRRIDRDVAVFTRAVDRVLVRRPDVAGFLHPELVAYRGRVRDLAWSGLRAEVAAASAAVAAYRGLETLLGRWVGEEEAASWAQRLTADGVGVPATPVGRALELLEEHHQPVRDRILSALTSFAGGSLPEVLEPAGAGGAEFARRLADEIDLLGSASVYAGPTWAEQEGYLAAMLRRLPALEGRASGAGALADFERTVMRTRRWRTVRVLTGQVVDARRRFLHRLVADASKLLRLREQAKARLLALGGEERRVIVEAAGRLTAEGMLPRPEDVELLADWELDAALARGEAVPLDELKRRRVAVAAWKSDEVSPFAAAPAAGGDAGMNGWGASPGRYRGRVRVVLDPAAVTDLEAGLVIVARATDPSWTPLLQEAGALVIEQGGPLSHAAIVAREFGVPAVLNVAGATARLRDGDLVEVDGTRGRITRLGGREREAERGEGTSQPAEREGPAEAGG